MAIALLLRKLARLSRRRRRLLTGALAALTLSTLALKLIPFSRLARWLGTSGQETPPQMPNQHEALARDIGWAVRAVAGRMPWKAECLVQALAATLLARFRRLPSTLYLGVAYSNVGQLQAHAWLRCGSHIVTGNAGHERFKAVATFARTQP